LNTRPFVLLARSEHKSVVGASSGRGETATGTISGREPVPSGCARPEVSRFDPPAAVAKSGSRNPVSLSSMSMRGNLRFLAVLIALVLGLAACGGARPTASAWSITWENTLNLVPEQSDLGEDPPKEQCETILASLREAQEDVIPTPDDLLDLTVNEWLLVAEGAFFECPPPEGGFDGAYRKLSQLEAEVDAFLKD
jgi:hypothetical protein